jgi:predicted transcriptional regulator
MKPYCEVVVQMLIPTMRALIAKELMAKYNLTQQDAAQKLGITQAAVSQYRRELRGSRVPILEKDKVVSNKIEALAGKMAANKFSSGLDAMEAFCDVCKTIRKRKIICKIHTECSPNLEECKVCLK